MGKIYEFAIQCVCADVYVLVDWLHLQCSLFIYTVFYHLLLFNIGMLSSFF